MMMAPKILYRNNRKFLLHGISLLTLVLSAFIFYMIFSDLERFFKEYSSRASGIVWMIFFLLAGNSVLLGMCWLSGRYVLLITESGAKTVTIKTWSIFGLYRAKDYQESILANAKFYFGKANFSHAPTVNAPWWGLKPPNGKTLIVDIQGEFFFEFKKK